MDRSDYLEVHQSDTEISLSVEPFFRDESNPLRKVLSGLGFLSCCSQMMLASSPSIPIESRPANPKSSHNALTASVRLAPSITSTRRPSRSWMPHVHRFESLLSLHSSLRGRRRQQATSRLHFQLLLQANGEFPSMESPLTPCRTNQESKIERIEN